MNIADVSAVWINLGNSPATDDLKSVVNKYFETTEIQIKDLKSSQVPQMVFVSGKDGNNIVGQLSPFFNNVEAHTRFVFFLEELSQLSISEIINSFDVLAVFGQKVSKSELEKVLERSQQDMEVGLKTIARLSEFKLQNRQLEVLTEDLEALVKERTGDIEVSKNQIELKVRKVKQLVSFIKSLSSIRRVEDLLIIIRDEIRKAYGGGEAFLGCDTGGYGPWILYFQRGDVSTVKTSRVWTSGVKLRINDKQDQQYLADTFGRPFGRVIAFPLQTKRVDSRDVVLFVEHQLPEAQIESFIEYMGERLQSLSLALDRSLLEVDLKRASFLWESTFDSIDDPIAIYTSDHEVIRYNKSFESLGKGQASLEIPDLVNKCIVSQNSSNASFRIGPQYFDAHCYPIRFHEEEPVSSVVTHFVDVTNYRNLQSTMIQNEKMSAIGHLAGNIAHELNNPLTGIRSLCQVLLAEINNTESQVANDLKEVEAAAGRSQNIINNLLSFSHTASDSQLSRVDLNDLVNITLPLLKSVTSEHRQEIELCESPLVVSVEPHLTQQVIFNLINNSCQAMREPGELKISTIKKGEMALFSVKDTGPGVSEKVSDSIFDPFVTTKSETGGTGLGLSMSHRVIRQMGGEIGFESEPGNGAQFWFSLPLSRGDKS